jgi:hypothetical protein
MESMRARLLLFFIIGSLLGGCSPTIRVPLSYSKNFTTGGGTTTATTVKPTAGFAITSGGRIATHPNAVLHGTIGKVGRPIIQSSASAKTTTGLQGALFVP